MLCLRCCIRGQLWCAISAAGVVTRYYGEFGQAAGAESDRDAPSGDDVGERQCCCGLLVEHQR